MTDLLIFSLMVLCLSICTAGVKAGVAAPQFAVQNQEFSVCVPNFTGRIGATDPDGDRVTYSLVASSTAALDYAIDTATGLVKSLRPFNTNERSVLTVQATDKDNRSSTTTVTVSYTDCGARVAEPVEVSEARVMEPLPSLTGKEGKEGLPILDETASNHKKIATLKTTTYKSTTITQPSVTLPPNSSVSSPSTSSVTSAPKRSLPSARSISQPLVKSFSLRYAPYGYPIGNNYVRLPYLPNPYVPYPYVPNPYIPYRPAPVLPLVATDPVKQCQIAFVDPALGLVRAGTRVAMVAAAGGVGNYYFTSLDSRFMISPSGIRTADIITRVPLPRADYPFVTRVQDGGGSSIETYVKICIR